MVITAGMTRAPGALPALCASAQIPGIENVEAAATQIEFTARISGGEEVAAKPRHDITNKGCCMPPAQLLIVFSSCGTYQKPRRERIFCSTSATLRFRKTRAVLL